MLIGISLTFWAIGIIGAGGYDFGDTRGGIRWDGGGKFQVLPTWFIFLLGLVFLLVGLGIRYQGVYKKWKKRRKRRMKKK